MLAAELAQAGLAVGSIIALAGLGLLVTYRATGVFNIGFGAVAMLVAYLLWQAVRVWHVPLWPAALVDVLVVAPGLGVLLDAAVFAPLQRRGASAAERLVASLGVFVLLAGVAFLVWGGNAHTDAPQLLPAGAARVAGVTVPENTLALLAAVLAVAAGLGIGSRVTRFGLRVRAVVDRRTLAELRGIDAPRIARSGWAFGCMLAGLAGVLLAPSLRLDPYGLSLVVLESMAVVLAARLSSIPVAVVVALGLGVAQSELTQAHPAGVAGPLVRSLATNLPAVALLVTALVLPPFREAGTDDAGRVARPPVRREARPAGWWPGYAVILLLPLGLTGAPLLQALRVPALAIIFLSLVIVTGYGGQINLGATGFAGLGALLTARLSAGHLLGAPLPVLVALVAAVLLTVPLGMLTGVPAVRRRGLPAMFTTFAVGTVVSRFVLEQPWATRGLTVTRPGPFTADRAFYLLELACLGLVLLFARALHNGRVGRALVAIRDSERGARAAGVDAGTLTVLVFGAGGAVAAAGGALLAMGGRAFDPSAFDPVQGLIWFAAVVVFGAGSAGAALPAAALIVALDAGVASGVSAVAIGALAVLLGHLPGGLSALRDAWSGAGPAPGTGPYAGGPPPGAGRPRLTPYGRQVARRTAARARPGTTRAEARP